MTQSDLDFAPFKEAFPHSALVDGVPVVEIVFDDITFLDEFDKETPVIATICQDGVVEFKNPSIHYYHLPGYAVARLGRSAMKTMDLFDAWLKTPSGIQWAGAQGDISL